MLNKLYIKIKKITGDKKFVTYNIMQNFNLKNSPLITGQELLMINDEILGNIVDFIDINYTTEILLLEKDPNVSIGGIKEGRVTFANTLKFIFNTKFYFTDIIGKIFL
jgi:magnesium-transporting ATPase (P-type)